MTNNLRPEELRRVRALGISESFRDTRPCDPRPEEDAVARAEAQLARWAAACVDARRSHRRLPPRPEFHGPSHDDYVAWAMVAS